MPTYGRVKVDTITYDLSGTATDVSVSNIATKASPTFTGTVTVPTASANDNTTKAASTAYVQTELGDYALKAGPTFTGTINAANLVLSADLTVNGTTTTINTTTLQVEDKNIEIGKVSSPSDATADGGGLTLLGATNKTWNWVNSTNAWTSSEHIHLLDNKKLIVGTGGSDLTISHDGTNSLIDNNTGNLNIQSGGTIYLTNAAGNEVYAQFSENGAASLRYDNTTRLATSATGCTVTGTLAATAVTGDGSGLTNLPPGGNTVELVADGAIVAGKPVIITTAGKAKAIGLTTQPKTNPSLGDHSQIGGNHDGSWPSAIWHTTSGFGLHCYRRIGNSNELRIGQFTLNSSTNFAMYATVNVYNNVTMHNKYIMDPDIDKPVLFYQTDHNGDKYVYSRSININGGGTGTPQASTSGASQPFPTYIHDWSWDVCYDTNSNIFVFVYRDNNSDNIEIRLGYQSEPATGQHKITWITTDFTLDSGTNLYVQCCFDTVNNKVIFGWGGNSGGDIKAAIGTVSGSGSSATISFGSSVTVNNDNIQNPRMAWHPDSGQAGFLYRDTTDGWNKLVTLKTSGTTVHYTGATRVGTENKDSFDLWYSSGTKTMRWSITGRHGWISSMGSAASGGANGGATNPTVGTGNVDLSSTMGGNISQYEPSRGFDLPENPLYTGFIVPLQHSSSYMKIGNMVIGANVSNVTASNVVGFAENAINDTATGTIKLTGNVVGNQSGLTAGTAYFVQGNGTLATSQDNTIGAATGFSKAGVALSATTLKISDYA